MLRYKLQIFFILTLIGLFTSSNVYGQEDDAMPNERIYLHINSSLLFPGDYLYYKCYLQRTDTKKLSDFSKVVYIELINEKKEIVFSHKLFTENGMIDGDFFVDQSLLSGNYKLIAFTQWMKNQSVSSFFQQEVSVINPYSPLPKGIFNSKSNEENIPLVKKTEIGKNTIEEIKENLKFKINGKTFPSRNKVALMLEALNDDARKGSYSISVRKRNIWERAQEFTAMSFDSVYSSIPKSTNLTANSVLPELRGELLAGKVVEKNSSVPVQNSYVVLSAEGNETLYDLAKTNENGIFHFNIDQPYDNNTFALDLIDGDSNTVELFPKEKNDYSTILFNKLMIDSSLESVILEKSIENQIENAFSAVKPDSVVPIAPKTLFDHRYLLTYRLDDYTRFSTLKQTFQEIIPEVSLRKGQGQQYFSVRTSENSLFDDKPSVVLLDGHFISNHSRLTTFDSRKIHQIQVFTSNFVKNGINFKGAILIQTKDNRPVEINQLYSGSDFFTIDVPHKRKKYFTPRYDSQTEKNNSVPDFRYQLLWQPNFVLNSETEHIEFFTSDVKGIFEVIIEGFTLSGEPISLKSRFEVN